MSQEAIRPDTALLPPVLVNHASRLALTVTSRLAPRTTVTVTRRVPSAVETVSVEKLEYTKESRPTVSAPRTATSEVCPNSVTWLWLNPLGLTSKRSGPDPRVTDPTQCEEKTPAGHGTTCTATTVRESASCSRVNVPDFTASKATPSKVTTRARGDTCPTTLTAEAAGGVDEEAVEVKLAPMTQPSPSQPGAQVSHSAPVQCRSHQQLPSAAHRPRPRQGFRFPPGQGWRQPGPQNPGRQEQVRLVVEEEVGVVVVEEEEVTEPKRHPAHCRRSQGGEGVSDVTSQSSPSTALTSAPLASHTLTNVAMATTDPSLDPAAAAVVVVVAANSAHLARNQDRLSMEQAEVTAGEVKNLSHRATDAGSAEPACPGEEEDEDAVSRRSERVQAGAGQGAGGSRRSLAASRSSWATAPSPSSSLSREARTARKAAPSTSRLYTCCTRAGATGRDHTTTSSTSPRNAAPPRSSRAASSGEGTHSPREATAPSTTAEGQGRGSGRAACRMLESSP